MKVAIVGAGVIGSKRAASLSDDDDLVMVCDSNESVGRKLSEKYDTHFTNDYRQVARNSDIDVVFISVINKYAAPIAIEMLKPAKHVLCEKPLGRNCKESHQILEAAGKSRKILKTGFNHRFHSSIMKVKKLMDDNAIGNIVNIRARYGHGGRPGMEQEWRCSKDLCGGGELLDQGVHIIDLCRWFLNREVSQVYGRVYNSFWPMEVEDNAFFHLEFGNHVLVQCHVSWTNWKNIFSFEIFGDRGYAKIDGLGGNYGKERMEVGYRNAEGGVPDIESYEFPDEDNSWDLEWKEFKQAIKEKREPIGSGQDGYEANRIVDAIYRSSNLGKPVPMA
jgi:predicted dehydrogenase